MGKSTNYFVSFPELGPSPPRIRCCSVLAYYLTSEHGDGPPACDGSLTAVLSERHLHEEEW